MKIETLYRYKRRTGRIAISPKMPKDKPYTEVYLLIADDGMILTNRETTTHCICVDNVDGWTEIDEPEINSFLGR